MLPNMLQGIGETSIANGNQHWGCEIQLVSIPTGWPHVTLSELKWNYVKFLLKTPTTSPLTPGNSPYIKAVLSLAPWYFAKSTTHTQLCSPCSNHPGLPAAPWDLSTCSASAWNVLLSWSARRLDSFRSSLSHTPVEAFLTTLPKISTLSPTFCMLFPALFFPFGT